MNFYLSLFTSLNRGLLLSFSLSKNMSGSLESLRSQNYDTIQDVLKSIMPPLDFNSHKGQAGRIGIVGGCAEYTGAPYFAAISALKVGCDLSHVFCTKEAAPVIKSYSPELIVHPLLDSPDNLNEIGIWMQRLHSMVIGPGLGRDPKVLNVAEEIIKKARSMNLPLVIDADGLFLITENVDIIKNYKRAILTPNVVEFSRLYKAVTGNVHDEISSAADVSQIAASLQNVTIVLKGKTDVISDGRHILVCEAEGSPRRCGGQGDLLSGSMGAFNFWCQAAAEKPNRHAWLNEYYPTLSAAFAACQLTRTCNKHAFQKLRRSMMTSDMIQEIPKSLEEYFE